MGSLEPVVNLGVSIVRMVFEEIQRSNLDAAAKKQAIAEAIKLLTLELEVAKQRVAATEIRDV